MIRIPKIWKGFLPSSDETESTDAIDNTCGPITQEEAAIAYGVLLLLGAIFIIMKIYKAKRSAERGVQHAADVMVFPIYFTFLKWNVAIFIARALMIVLLPHENPLYGAAYLGLLTGMTASFREGLVVFFLQKSAGRASVLKASVFGCIWGLILAVMGASFYFEHHANRNGDEDLDSSEDNGLNDIFPEYLGTSLLYFLLYDGLIFTFHLVALLYMSIRKYLHNKKYSPKYGKRFNNTSYAKTPSRFSNMHLFYSGLNIFVFGTFLASDVLAMLGSMDQMISGCIAISGQFMDYSVYVVLLYYVLLYDSYYWRNLKPKINTKQPYGGFTPIGMNINSEEAADVGQTHYYSDASRSSSDYDDDEDDSVNKPFLSKSLLEREIRSGMRQYNKPQQRLSDNSFKQGSWVEPTPNEKAQVWIDFSRIRFGKVIGEGATARVFEGFLDNRPVALKLIRCDKVDQELIREIVREVAITNSLKHPNIIHLYGVSLWLPDLVMVLEYAQRGSLFFLLPSVKLFSLKDKMKLCLDVIKAIHFLHYHEPALIHLDIKSLNLLVDKDWNIKLADFGESRSLNNRLSRGHRGTFEPRGTTNTSESLSPRATFLSYDSESEEPIIGTVQWLAPEAISHRQYTDKTDIYAVGVVINEIMSGLPPFHDKKPQELPLLIVGKKLRPTIPMDCPPSIQSIIEKCWSENPSSRPNAIELLGMLRAVSDSGSVQNMRSTSESWKILDSII